MGKAFGFTRTEPSKINETLSRLFDELNYQGSFLQASGTNMIILGGEDSPSGRLASYLDLLTTIYPGRYFAVSIDSNPDELSVAVAARCHGLTREQSVCSAVVRISVGSNRLGAVPSLIRAHTLVGYSAEMLILDPAVEEQAVKLFSPICQRIVFDASLLADRLPFVRSLPKRCGELADIHWAALEPWRACIEEACRHAAVGGLSKRIKEVEVHARSGAGQEGTLGAYLLAGWLAECFELSIEELGKDGFRCSGRNPLGSSLRVFGDAAPSSSGEIAGQSESRRRAGGIRNVTLTLVGAKESGSGEAAGEGAHQIQCESLGSVIQSSIVGSRPRALQTPVEDATLEDLLEKTLIHPDRHYADTLSCGLAMYELAS